VTNMEDGGYRPPLCGLFVSVSLFVECGYVLGQHRRNVFALDHKNMSRLFCRLLFLLPRRLVSGMVDGG